MQILLVGGLGTVPLSVAPQTKFGELVATTATSLDTRHDMWCQFKGKRLEEQLTLQEAGVRDGDTIRVHLRLRGGGGDGGATGAESRSSYLEMYLQKKPDKVNPAEEKLARWTMCKLSGEILQPPCVVDELGSLYNKEAVVSALVSKTMPPALGHISSLKHISEVKLAPIDGLSRTAEVTNRDFQPGNNVHFQCPISGQPLNGQYRFCVILPSGHCVSEKAVKQVPTAVEELAGGTWKELRPLNGTQEEVESLWDSLIASRAFSKKAKKQRQKAQAESIAAIHAVERTIAPNDQLRKSSSEDSPTTTTERKLQLEDQSTGAGVKRGMQDFSNSSSIQVKRLKAKDMAPAHADKKVWASLFTSTNGKQSAETYACRSTSARGWT